MVTRSNVGCVWTPIFKFGGSLRRKVNGVAAFRSPSITAILAPGPTDGASDHLSLDASTEMKAGPSAADPAQAAGPVSNPAANVTETRTLLNGFIFASFASHRSKLCSGPLEHWSALAPAPARCLPNVKRQPRPLSGVGCT